jgi:hypothetical protein
VDAGYLQRHELSLLIKSHTESTASYWVPMNWAFSLCYELRKSGNIEAEPILCAILNEFKLHRERLQALLNFDWVPVPLAYSQVVFLAVRLYFFICIFARQNIFEENSRQDHDIVDIIFPFMTLFQALVYLGWIKVQSIKME